MQERERESEREREKERETTTLVLPKIATKEGGEIEQCRFVAIAGTDAKLLLGERN